jgi:hypothetical protein
MIGLTTGCGGDSGEPADCADLADEYVEITSEIVGLIGDRTMADMESPPPEIEEAADEWFESTTEVIPRIGELCDEGEFDRLLCDRKSSIEPAGEAGERFLAENYPGCSD